jgi:hypothetical protein
MHIANLSLTDFSSSELNFLYLTLEEKKKDLDYNFEVIETMPHGDLKYDLFGQNTIKYTNCCQWMTKVDEAQKFVRTREIMTSEN